MYHTLQAKWPLYIITLRVNERDALSFLWWRKKVYSVVENMVLLPFASRGHH